MASDDEQREQDEAGREDREAILARRRRFVVAALTGLTTTTLATACPCLEVAAPPENDGAVPAEAQGDGDKSEDKDDGDPVEEASPQDGEIPPPAADGE